MLDFEVHRCSRRCSRTDRELRTGEPVYSALVARGAQVVRLDYAHEAWTGPPADSIGWWKSVVPDAGGPKVHWAPNDVMLHYFEQLEDVADQQDVRYVLALLMIRRRIVKQEETEKDEQGRELLVLYSPRTERQHRVLAELPDERRIAEIQDQLAKLLYADPTSAVPLPAIGAASGPAPMEMLEPPETPDTTASDAMSAPTADLPDAPTA